MMKKEISERVRKVLSCEAQEIERLENSLSGEQLEQIKEAMRDTRKLEQLVKRYKKDNDLKGEAAIDLIMREAKRLMGGADPDPKVLSPVMFSEKGLYEFPGSSAEPIDYTEALERMAAAK